MDPLCAKKWLKRVVIYATCASATYSAWLIYSAQRPVVSVMISAAMTWLSVFLGDPWGKEATERIESSMSRLCEAMQGLEERMDARMQGLEERLNERMQGLEERVNVRFDNLEISIGTPPGAPAGVDETVTVKRAADPDWIRPCDEELENRIIRRRRNMPDTILRPPVPVFPAE